MTLWLDTPVLWHTSHVPSGYDYEAMTAEQRALIRERFHDVCRASVVAHDKDADLLAVVHG